MNIEISGVSKSFGEKIVLSDFSASFDEKSITCITGPSGCGKTTLLRLLMGLEAPDKGVITGVPALKAAVFQEDRLCEHQTALANVLLCADKGYSKADAIDALERIGLSDALCRPVSSLSGGMRRRTAVVRAVMAKSDIIFLDEAFKGLDDETRFASIEFFKERTRGKTVLSVTHSVDEAKLLGARRFDFLQKK